MQDENNFKENTDNVKLFLEKFKNDFINDTNAKISALLLNNNTILNV